MSLKRHDKSGKKPASTALEEGDSKSQTQRSTVTKDIPSSERPDIPALMSQIRDRIKEDIEENKDKRPIFAAKQANPDSDQEVRAGEIVHSEELQYLHRNYNFAPALNLDSIQSHRKGPIGKLIVKSKRKLLSVVWDLLKGYFESEREFNANLVRHLSNASRYTDARDAASFWELIRKIDYDVTKAIERIERINDEQSAEIRSTERRMLDSLDISLSEVRQGVAELKTKASQHSAHLETLEGVGRGLETVVTEITRPVSVPQAEESEEVGTPPDYSYRLLENRFRGSEDEIRKRLSIYPPLFKEATEPILDLGGGRGECLELIKAAGMSGYIVDPDEAMIRAAQDKGLDARVGDGIAHLRSLDDNSLGGIIAIQVVEHLTKDQLEELSALASKKVVSGGKVIFETINPRSVLALSSNYFRDLTHVFPLHPDTLDYVMTLSGLEVVEVRELSPVSREAQLRPLEIDPYMTPRWAFAVETLNRNFELLNSLLYGFQDFCIIAEAK